MECTMCHSLWIAVIFIASGLLVTRGEGTGTVCTEGSVRLTFSSEGHVETCHNQSWERLQVCGASSWGLSDSAVVCRELGYVPWDASVTLFTTNVSGRIVDGACDGTEASFNECHTVFEGNCTQPQDVWLSCIEASVCSEGEVRLLGGESAMEGQVKVCVEGGWGTVCHTIEWDDSDASVICRQLGFSPYNATTGNYSESLEGGFSVVESKCSGEEEIFTNCNNKIWALARCPTRTAGVTCQGPKPSYSKSSTTLPPSPSTVATSSQSHVSKGATSVLVSSDRGVDIGPTPAPPKESSEMPLLAAFLGGCGVLLLCAVMTCIASIAILVKARKHRQHVHTTSDSANAKASTFHNPVYGANGITAGPEVHRVAIMSADMEHETELINPLYSIPTSPASTHVPYSHIYADRMSTAGIIDTVVQTPAANSSVGCATKEGAYSQLDLAGPNQYATLEPFITGKPEGDSGDTKPAEGYSHLSHS